MSDSNNPLGTRIQELRESINLKQIELAKKAGIPRSLMAMIEKGERYPSNEALEKIITALKIDKELLFNEEVRLQAIKILENKVKSNIDKADTAEIIKAARKIFNE